MAESMDSRKFEKRSHFDVPLPIRKVQRVATENIDEDAELPAKLPPATMAFSLMTKRGNRPQVPYRPYPPASQLTMSRLARSNCPPTQVSPCR